MTVVINGTTGFTGPQSDGDATINGITVGKGLATVSTNTAVGASALAANTSGATNTAVGNTALQANTTGINNSALGHAALVANLGGSENSAYGSTALVSNTSGSYNTAVGRAALYSNTTASNNTAVGYQAGYTVTGGVNTCLGNLAGTNLTTGNYNLYIGSSSTASSGGVAQEMVICTGASGATGKGNNTAFISANGGSTYNGANTTTWATTSDERIKKNIVDVTDGLSKISALRPVEFEYKENNKHEVGFIAQEYQQVLPDQIITHAANEAEKEWVDGDVMAIQQNLTPYLVKAIQELKADLDATKAELAALKA